MSTSDITRVAVTHTIEQRFEHPVRLSTHWLRLRPAPQTRAGIAAYSLALHAEPHFLNWVRDPFENHLARLDLPEPVASLGIELEFIAELAPVNPFDFLTEPDAATCPFVYAPQLRKELGPYLRVGAPGPRFATWLAQLDNSPAATVARLESVNRQVHERYGIAPAVMPGPVNLEQVLAQGEGSPWDLAWLLTLSFRHLGLAARFVYGYRIALAPPDTGMPDSVSLHAWSEVYLPGAGWIGLDPAAGLFTTECYVPFACAPDPLRVLPIVGYREACEERCVESLRVRRLTPAQHPWPYTEAQWADLRALGCHLEQDLTEQGLRPALGTSLSLVSTYEAEAPEWNTAALGLSKRQAADELLQRLWLRLAPGGAPQLGQGEWYAGDALPRWRLGCFFRADGHPLWRNPARLGWRRAGDDIGPDDARDFAHALARALGVSAGHVIAAHEDALHELSRTRMPFDYVPSAEELDDPERRRALAERLSRCRGEPTGYALPIRWEHAAGQWTSGVWRFRRDGLYLMPGDSPMGYRLPLDSLVADAEVALESQAERCPFEERPLLPELYGEVSARLSAVGAPRPGIEPADAGPNGERTPRTAVCVEVRRGRLHVFLPPVSHLEHYLELVAGIEAAAEAMDIAVLLEGYEPPEDYRLRRLVLEPDAGVLRLTLPETQGWEQQLGLLEAAYEEAARCGLRAERVMPDGRRLPSGGGGRLTVGGTRPADSPFLKRPEILRSLIAYWQRHPSLSYFFAGRAIGPAGSAPRPDEGRDETLYELSLALERLPQGESQAPWLTDRVLRHLLTDPGGDIRRAELRVDQLYAPERAALRLGRILIGAFETAPEQRLAALQSLLVLGLLGRCARAPGSAQLRRWGPALHDRFMLPGVLWEDLRSVIEDLNAAGYPFQLEWFEPLLALRFPVLGQVQLGAITLELQAAHEPWPLLAEEVTAGGVARFIDVANERVQVRLAGLTPDRYVLACNGYRVPLQGTGVHGECLAGVRYKVSNPPATRHPTLAPVEALVFDLIDTWSGLAIGGCSYFPPRPVLQGAVASAPRPSPATQASADMLPPTPPVSVPPRSQAGRFLPQGSGPGPMAPPAAAHDERYPYLLDLTRIGQ